MHMDVGLGHPLDEGDAEVSAAFRISAPTVALMQPTSAVSVSAWGYLPGDGGQHWGGRLVGLCVTPTNLPACPHRR